MSVLLRVTLHPLSFELGLSYIREFYCLVLTLPDLALYEVCTSRFMASGLFILLDVELLTLAFTIGIMNALQSAEQCEVRPETRSNGNVSCTFSPPPSSRSVCPRCDDHSAICERLADKSAALDVLSLFAFVAGT